MTRPPLEVTPVALCVGAESIGLPTVRSVDTVFDAYFRLVDRLRAESCRFEFRSDDVERLAEATGLDCRTVEARLQRVLS